MTSTSRQPDAVSTVEEVVQAVRCAVESSQTLTAARHAGEHVCQLDLSPMNRIVDYPARDMTITVEAGVTLSQLTDVLQSEGQVLPVDMADPAMSVGAFVAADLSGPRQYGYGTLRDYLIGLEAVDGQGRQFHAGGRVVKNVAGYDLCRLAVGSQGTIGILTQLTFKLKPAPEHFAMHRWTWNSGTPVAAALDRLNTSSARPVVLDLARPDRGTWTLCMGVDGTPAVCEWQIGQIEQELHDATDTATLCDSSEAALTWCAQAAERHLNSLNTLTIRTRPSQVVELCKALAEYAADIHCHAGNGVVLVRLNPQTDAATATTSITGLLQQSGGQLLKTGQQADQFRRPDSWSKKVISAFDPHNVFA